MRSVSEEMQLPSNSALIQPILGPSSRRRGTWGEGQAIGSAPLCPPWEAGARVCGAKPRGVHSYQVWRGGLGLRSVIVHVQIDQDFSRSPYSTGHFPYRQLPKSRGGEGRQTKIRPVSSKKENEYRLDVGQGSTPSCKQRPTSCDRQNQPGAGSRHSGEGEEDRNGTL